MTEELAKKRQAQIAKNKPTEQRREGVTPAKGVKAVVATTPAPIKVYVPLPELKESCPACGSPLKYIPVNSRLKAVACTKIGCTLYRERIRTVALKEVKEVSHATG